MVLTLFGVCSTVLFHAFLNARLLEVGNRPLTKPTAGSAAEANQPGTSTATVTTTASPPPTTTSTTKPFASDPQRKSWLVTSLLVRVALLYVASRLFITLAQVYLPLYIEETNVAGRQALATVPLTSYAASFVAAMMLKYINRSCGTKVRKVVFGLSLER